MRLILAVLVAGLLLLHRFVPNRFGHLGSLVEAFLPWLGLAVVALFAAAVWRPTRIGIAAVVLPAVAWLATFGGQLLPADAARPDLVAVQHNLSDENPDPSGTAAALAAIQPDLIGAEEVTPDKLPTYEQVLGGAYPYHVVYGTVGLWSRYRIMGSEELDIKPRGLDADWRRGLRAVLATPSGEVVAYVAHLPSVRVGLHGFNTTWRDDSAGRLGALIAADPHPRLILLGDLNATVDDRGLRPVSSQLRWARSSSAWSFPAAAPIGRIDQIMARGAAVTGVWTLPRTGSDHLPIAAHLQFRS